MDQRLYLDEARPGDLLASPAVGRTGTILLEAGTVLTSQHIESLRAHRVIHVDVRDEIGAETDDLPAAPAWDEIAAPPFRLSRPPDEIAAAIERAIASSASVGGRHSPQAPQGQKGQPFGERPFPQTPQGQKSRPFDAAEVRHARRQARLLRRRAVETVGETFDRIARRSDPRLTTLKDLTRSLVAEGLANPHVFPSMVSLHAYDDHLVDQAVRSTCYAILVGAALGLEREELEEVAECALLHDVGMARVPPAIWRKAGPLDLGERLAIQRHVIYGADLLEKAPGVSPWAAVVAYQHHEYHDGSGYPKGRTGRGIFEYARIVGLADHYAARTAPRPHRDRQRGYEVMTDLLYQADRLFDGQVVRALLAALGLHPVGEAVRLSDGSTAVVVAAHPSMPYRPVVRVLLRPDGTPPYSVETSIVDLSTRQDVAILRAA